MFPRNIKFYLRSVRLFTTLSSLIYVLLQNLKILTIRNTYVGTLNSHEIDIIEYAIVLQFFESDDIYDEHL